MVKLRVTFLLDCVCIVSLGTLLGKCSKILNVLFRTYISANIFVFMPLFPKILGGMANSVDPDQTTASGAGAV